MQTKFDVGQTVYIPFKIIKISATKNSKGKDNIEYKVKSLHSLSSPFYADIVEQDILKWKAAIKSVPSAESNLKARKLNNSEKFKDVFGLYATEVWAMSNGDFGNWISAEYEEPEPEQSKIIRCKDCRYSEETIEKILLTKDIKKIIVRGNEKEIVYERRDEGGKMSNLKPCPFCGGEAEALLGYILYLNDDGDEVEFYDSSTKIWFGACVYCPKCRCEIERKKKIIENPPDGWYDQIKQDAVEAWNRRVNDDTD